MLSPFHAASLVGASLLSSLFSVPFVRTLCWRLGLVDRPEAASHKSHLRPTPYGGGIAIWTACVFPSVAILLLSGSGSGPSGPIFLLLLCATALFLVGFLDDWIGLSPLLRFLVQTASAAVLVAIHPEFRLPFFEAIPGLPELLSLLWIVALTNAFNFLDNMDGLSSGICAVALLFLIAIGWSVRVSSSFFVVGLALLGGIAGFLMYNFPPASIFMGDAGGLFIGFLAGGLSAFLSHRLGALSFELPGRLSPLLVLTVPVYDLIGVSLIRIRNRIPPWIGDNNHISHRLTDLGLSRRSAVLVIHAATLLNGIFVLPVLLIPSSGRWLLVGSFVFLILLTACLDFSARRKRLSRQPA